MSLIRFERPSGLTPRKAARLAVNVLANLAVPLSSIPGQACHAAAGTTQARGSDLKPQACAAFDLLHLTSIEDAGSRPSADHDAIAATAFRLLEARTQCRQGYIAEALDLYSRIAVDGPFERFLR
jgi:hypothetical protein